MSVVNYATGEIVDGITEMEVRASIRRVIDHAESIWDEWAWQVENRTWEVLGYASWDEMRRGEYGSLTSVTAPRAERPELVSRFRRAGLTQKQTADTLGVSQRTVSNHDTPRETHPRRSSNIATSADRDDEIIDAEIVEDAPPFAEGPPQSEQEKAAPSPPSEVGSSTAKGVAAPSTPSPAPHIQPVPKSDDWTEQDRAEELAANLAAHISMLYALTDSERRAEYIALWHLGVDHRPVLGQKYVEPKTMRRIADALRTFASEWEQAHA